MLYHVSEQAGLKTLVPHVSTHKKPYVYAIENAVTGLLFGVRQDDFDFQISTDKQGRPTVCECYPGALERRYRGKRCSVYMVDGADFQRGRTSWDSELVCESEVPVLCETVVNDIYERLLEEEAAGNITLCRYECNDRYRQRISKHIVDRLIRFEVDLPTCMETDGRFSEHYKGIVEALLSVMDGHLLK
ncbi:MAG: hypothetical protein Q4C48_02910 [Lachnospiraceae bacterium]|nr:hypothetical protein [Lachnospiraceae bacterium]